MTIIGSLPINLLNNTLADATQVMSDFNYIVTQVNANAAALTGGNAFTGAQTIAGDTITTNFATQTLTNKTLTSPVIPVIVGTVAFDKFTIGTDGRVYGSALHNNAGSMTGTVNQYIGSGTYIPATTALLNVSANTPNTAKWMRLGNVVQVSGSVSITPTAGASTLTELTIALPIASSIALADCCGTASAGATVANSGNIQGYVPTLRALIAFLAPSNSAASWYYTYQYEVL